MFGIKHNWDQIPEKKHFGLDIIIVKIYRNYWLAYFFSLCYNRTGFLYEANVFLGWMNLGRSKFGMRSTLWLPAVFLLVLGLFVVKTEGENFSECNYFSLS